MQAEVKLYLSSEGKLLVRLSGQWKLGKPLPSADRIKRQIDAGPEVQQAIFDTTEITEWDTGLLSFVVKLMRICSRDGITVETGGLPEGIRRLLLLYSAQPERKDARREKAQIPLVERVGDWATEWWRSFMETLDFIGAAAIALMRLLTGKAQFRSSDLFILMQQCGVEALPIVSLISILSGLVLAYVSSLQLKFFGAQIYVASMVGIGVVRVLAPVMTGVIMAGRTGAAFAAQIGTMEVNEEIDALKTFAISPMEFLVLPRMLALFFMMPLLVLYADLLGIVGGMIIGVYVLNLDYLDYYNKTREAVSLNHFWIGLLSAAIFGLLVAVTGCLRGIQCRRSALGVGEAATSAVVTGVIGIVVALATITVISALLNI